MAAYESIKKTHTQGLTGRPAADQILSYAMFLFSNKTRRMPNFLIPHPFGNASVQTGGRKRFSYTFQSRRSFFIFSSKKKKEKVIVISGAPNTWHLTAIEIAPWKKKAIEHIVVFAIELILSVPKETDVISWPDRMTRISRSRRVKENVERRGWQGNLNGIHFTSHLVPHTLYRVLLFPDRHLRLFFYSFRLLSLVTRPFTVWLERERKKKVWWKPIGEDMEESQRFRECCSLDNDARISL